MSFEGTKARLIQELVDAQATIRREYHMSSGFPRDDKSSDDDSPREKDRLDDQRS